MKTLVQEFASDRLQNPEDPVDVGTRFQQHLMAGDPDLELSEKDVIEGAYAAGIHPELVPDFLESFSTWL